MTVVLQSYVIFYVSSDESSVGGRHDVVVVVVVVVIGVADVECVACLRMEVPCCFLRWMVHIVP